jgi:hypothetical protein
MEEWMDKSTFLDLSTSWRWVISSMTKLFQSRENNLSYALAMRVGGPQASLDNVEKRKFLLSSGLEL